MRFVCVTGVFWKIKASPNCFELF